MTNQHIMARRITSIHTRPVDPPARGLGEPRARAAARHSLRARRLWRVAEAALLGLVALAGSAQAEADPLPRYQAVLEQELTTLKLDPACTAVSATETHCELTMGTPAGQRFEARAIYSDVTDTVYLYVPDFLELPASSASTDGVLRRLMELNAELLACKLEWHPASGEVRLSTLLHTDSNFDRRSLRGLVHALRRAAMRYQGELQRLAGNAPDARPRAAAP